VKGKTMAKRPGRKAAKNDIAQALLNALAFCNSIKAPTTTSLPYGSHIFLNESYAIAFDGIVAAGHIIPAGIAGYPHTKLFTEALANCGKDFTLTMRENGHLQIESGNEMFLVPSLDFTQVVPTPPDANMAPVGPEFLKAVEAAGKVVADNDQTVLFGSIRLNGNTVMATDGTTLFEAYHGYNTPPGLMVPKAFVTALTKTGKIPVGIGMSANWETFTCWFEDGSWLRTATYGNERWPEEILSAFPTMFGIEPLKDMPAKLFDNLRAILPFTDENDRAIIRTGLVRTHSDRRLGAAVENTAIAFDADISAKRLLAVEEYALAYNIGNGPNGKTFCFCSPVTRGLIQMLDALPEYVEQPANNGWAVPTVAETPAPAAEASPWVVPGASPAVTMPLPPSAPAAQPETTQRIAQPAGEWVGGPQPGLLNDPDFRDQAGLDTVDGEVEFDFAAAFGNGGAGIASGWVSSLDPDTGE
jgi:hypothetical protein